MKDFFKIKIVYMALLAVIVIIAVLVALFSRNTDNDKYEPASPEEPRLVSMGVDGYKIKFSPEKRYYEIELPSGNPIVPKVWATADENVNVEILQANIGVEKSEGSAKVFLDTGDHQNSYEIHFIREAKDEIVLQYDDRYTFVPEYKLKDGEKFAFECSEKNITIDENGVIRVVGVSDEKATVKALVNDKVVDTLEIEKTEEALIDVFVVAGQGNAAGEGGSAEESTKCQAGIAYTSEINDRTNSLVDLCDGREGFTPAIAEKWYSLTGRKTLFIQTAVSDASVKLWTSDGEVFEMAKGKITDVFEKFNEENFNYVLNDTYCLWLQGEWDIAENMSALEYITYFTNFYQSIKEVAKPKMLGIIPVRSSLNTDSEKHSIEPVCSAQYYLSNMYGDIRIITRIPETASIENGYVSEGNLYYTQTGYNVIGADVAFNVYSCYNLDTEKSPKAIEVFGKTHQGLYKYGETITIDKDEELRTVAILTPLYAEKGEISVDYDSNLINYAEGGVISRTSSNTELATSEICFSCGDMEFRFNIAFSDKDDELPQKAVSYFWEFDELNTTEKTNALTLSELSNKEGYVLKDGKIVSNDRQVDFLFEKSVVLTGENNWDIEWKGSINDNGIILGGDNLTKGYIYLAPFAENMNFSVRMVDDEGKTFYLPFGDYAELCKTENEWRINYNKESKLITLYSNGLIVSKSEVNESFEFTLTNLFGRYGSENINYCYTGLLDWLKISVR